MKPPAIRFAAMAKKVTATLKSQNVRGPNDMRAVLPTQAPVARNSWKVDFLRPACSDVSVRALAMYCYPYKMLSMRYILRRAFWKVKDALHIIFLVEGYSGKPKNVAASSTVLRSDTTALAGNESSGHPSATAFMMT